MERSNPGIEMRGREPSPTVRFYAAAVDYADACSEEDAVWLEARERLQAAAERLVNCGR